MQELTDHAAVRHDHDTLVGMGGDDAYGSRATPLVEVVVRLGARDHVPALFGEDLREDRIAGRGALAELAALPLAEEHLAQVGFDLRA